MLPVEQPYKIYTDLDGKPLDGGFVYFGEPDDNPVTAPVTVYWDAEGTLPALQPLRTVNGYLMRAGTPANVFFAGSYSELVRNAAGIEVYYARNSDDFSIGGRIGKQILADAADLLTYTASGAGSVPISFQNKLGEFLSVKDKGAKGDGVAFDTDAIAKAIAASSTVIFPPGTYRKTGSQSIPSGTTILLCNAHIVQEDDQTAFSGDSDGWKIVGTGMISRRAGVPEGLVESSVGIAIGSTASRYGISGDISIVNFANAGLLLDGGGIVTGEVGNGKIDGLTCRNNVNGFVFRSGFASEYATLSNCQAFDNISDGVYIESGNINWTGGTVTGNGSGFHLKHPANGANPHHGMVIGAHINHNRNYQVYAENVAAGFDFVGCHMYDNADVSKGRIRLENSRGVQFANGTIGCGIEAVYTGNHPHYGYNRITGNLFVNNAAIITGTGYTREKLLVIDNYTFSGPSKFNDPSETFAMRRHSVDYAATGNVNLASVGEEVFDNRGALLNSFVAPATGWYTVAINLRLEFAAPPTTEYIAFMRDDAASGNYIELYRVSVAQLASGSSASINVDWKYVCSEGGQLNAFLISPGGNAITIKTGSQISFENV